MTTKRFAVVGNPIAHSLSPVIHAAFARALKIPLIYERMEPVVDRTGEAFLIEVKRFFGEGGAGLNVTAPFKQMAFAAAKEVSDVVQNAEAANTLTALSGEAWRADNTDGIGLQRDLMRHLGRLNDARILIYGAGGAVSGVLHHLLSSGVKVFIYNRTLEKAQHLADKFHSDGEITVLPSIGRETVSHPFDCVIHATSVRTLPTGITLWNDALYSDRTFYYDMGYAAEDTAFLSWVKSRGSARLCNGLGMLVEQAAESFFIWHGILPEVEPVLRDLRAR
ncbi:MAG: shikimate dehydrogenase [Burkholderiales bacterium]|jgi:shikimate dehydrogenase|nr:shikimate dehydrogenase [Burkholderiales bacterium]